jgi:hypothetical protein
MAGRDKADASFIAGREQAAACSVMRPPGMVAVRAAFYAATRLA